MIRHGTSWTRYITCGSISEPNSTPATDAPSAVPASPRQASTPVSRKNGAVPLKISLSTPNAISSITTAVAAAPQRSIAC